MWIFSRHGFYSITRSVDEPGKLQVRARCESDLVNLKKLAGLDSKTLETPHADYRWRLIVAPEQGEQITTALTRDIYYSNFKGAAAREPDQSTKLQGLHDIWEIHHGWQK